MIELRSLIEGIGCGWNGVGDLRTPVVSIQTDSRGVKVGDLFVAVRGFEFDGHQFVNQAVQAGASAVLGERAGLRGFNGTVPVLLVQDSREALAKICRNYYGSCDKKLKLIGVTGTNGKTTIGLLTHFLLNRFSKCGLMGTIFYDNGREHLEAGNTTPGTLIIHEALSEMIGNELSYCVMEVSSHALDQKRTDGLWFRHAIFTNLTQDHFDYHPDFEHYYQAKRRLFDADGRSKICYLNREDTYGRRLAAEINGNRVITYGFHPGSDYSANNINVGLDRISFELVRGTKVWPVEVPLALKFNVLNVLSVLACLDLEGFAMEELIQVIRKFPGVPGRMERIDEGQDFHVFVDYAHSPNAMLNVLASVKDSMEKQNGARILVVFGCGGDRDREKRSIMGEIAADIADFVVLTSDNPRSESPGDILRQIEAGVQRSKRGTQYQIIENRSEAIELALLEARTGDVVLVLGKGHEQYQIFGKEKFPFSDQNVIRYVLSSKRGASF